MPCYAIVLVSVKFNAKSIDRLKEVLSEMGLSIYKERDNVIETYDFRFDFDTGEVKFDSSKPQLNDQVNRIKREYTFKTVKEISAKKKWHLKMKSMEKGYKLTAKKY